MHLNLCIYKCCKKDDMTQPLVAKYIKGRYDTTFGCEIYKGGDFSSQETKSSS